MTGPLRQLRPEDYSVGIVCALPVELTAIIVMLDEKHRGLPTNGSETNLYTLGRIADHNVVIVCLPVSRLGTSSAANVAAQMKTRFTSIRFSLMVGIGGGVPSADSDIRLGDVVIGLPQKRNGGVVQYDFGKTNAGGRFAHVGCLDKPPTVLLNAVSKLQACRYHSEGSLFQHLSTPQIRRKFGPPEVASDVLFEPGYNHVEGLTCAGCDGRRSVQRIPRKDREPIIHYGTIASGNQVMKDGITRDRLSAGFGGVLCFEMEAAGLVDNLPCLIIRGICDYADSHKHKDWQPYAAVTAAAFAKEILSIIPAAEVPRARAVGRREHGIDDMVSSLAYETVTRKSCFDVPFSRNPHLVGRTPHIAQLEAQMFAKDQSRKVAIVGLGGVGKTQIALELAYREKDRYPDCSIFWVPATSMANVQQAYLAIGRQLRVPGLGGQEDVKKLVQRYLSQDIAGRWLIVFDNADDVSMWIGDDQSEQERLIDYLPRSDQGSIVFTTRNRKGATKLVQNRFLEVQEMEEEVALAMLRNCLHDKTLVQSREDAVRLLDQLTHLPLAIAQATAYINENSITLLEYSTLLSDKEENVLEVLSEDFEDQGRYHSLHTKNPVATTWLISLEQIQRHDRLAADYLSFMACIDPRNIPLSLLPRATRKKELDAMGTLSAYSFITKRTRTQSLDIHPLVHLVTRNWLRQNGRLDEWKANVITRLNVIFPVERKRSENRALWRTYLPHVRYIFGSENETLPNDASVEAELLEKFGLCLMEDGMYNEAKKPLLRSWELRKTALGTEHPVTLCGMASLAEAVFNQGRYREVEDLDKQLIEKSVRVLGPNDPATLARKAHLALAYRKQGRWKSAEELELLVLETRTKLLGSEHPDTLDAMANVGVTLEFQERHEEAENLLRRVTEQRVKSLGGEHCDTLYSMYELAWTLYMQGKLQQAEQLELQVIDGRIRILGSEHPDTLGSKVDLGQIYLAQQRSKEAENLLILTTEAFKRQLGEENPRTLISMHNRAAASASRDRRTEAIDLLQYIIGIRKRVLGVDHFSTQRSVRLLDALERRDAQASWAEISGLAPSGVSYYDSNPASQRIVGTQFANEL
ncbi:MAG: hypothetical protein M1821_002470 [Bathelium mastoideum]|nr:MAG: hypothetical protein M1821_002470 [Bathelium mastoideum]